MLYFIGRSIGLILWSARECLHAHIHTHVHAHTHACAHTHTHTMILVALLLQDVLGKVIACVLWVQLCAWQTKQQWACQLLLNYSLGIQYSTPVFRVNVSSIYVVRGVLPMPLRLLRVRGLAFRSVKTDCDQHNIFLSGGAVSLQIWASFQCNAHPVREACMIQTHFTNTYFVFSFLLYLISWPGLCRVHPHTSRRCGIWRNLW